MKAGEDSGKQNKNMTLKTLYVVIPLQSRRGQHIARKLMCRDSGMFSVTDRSDLYLTWYQKQGFVYISKCELLQLAAFL